MQCFAPRAGSRLTLDGKPLTYGRRNQADDADFANPNFVARGERLSSLQTALRSSSRHHEEGADGAGNDADRQFLRREQQPCGEVAQQDQAWRRAVRR